MKLFGGKRVHRRFVEVAAGLCAIALSTSAVAAWDAFGDAWLPPQQLSGIGATMSSDIRDREVAIAPDGTVLVVWLGPDGNYARVHARIRKPGARFGATQLLSPPGISASAPQVAVHRDGTALVVWSEGGVAKYAVREPGTRTFGPPRTPTTWTAVDDVRFDGTGAAVIVYRSGATLRAAVRAPDSEFAPSQQLDAIDLRFGNGAISPATLAADGRGTVYAAWGGSYYSTGASGASGPSGSSSYIRAAVRPSGGSFSPAPHLDSFCGPGQCRPYYPTLAASHKAGAVIAWYIETGGLSGAAILRAASLPEGRLLLGGSGFDPLPPVLAVDGLGAVTLGWMEDRLVHLRTRLATGLEQAGPTGEAGSGLRLAADGVGRTFAVWDSAYAVLDPDSAVRAAIRAPAGPFGQIREISLGGRVDDPDVVADRAGNALATWTQTDAGGSALWFAVYDGAGPRLSRVRTPRRARTGRRLTFSVSPHDVWSPSGVATVWRFGDGKKARGARVRHTYRHAGGRFKVSVTVTDTAGNSTTKRRTIHVRDVTRPRITRLRVGRSGRMRFRLTERARIRVFISRLSGGDRFIRRAPGKPGRNRIGLGAAPGRYVATIIATDRAGLRSRPRSFRFRVR